MADAYGFVGGLLRRLRFRDNGDNSFSPLVSLGPGRPAAYQGWGILSGPGTNATIVTSGALAGGRYRIVAYAYSDDSALAGRNLQLLYTSGGAFLVVVQGLAGLAVTLPDVAIDAGSAVLLRTGSAGSAGAYYYGALLVYPLP